MEEKEKPDGGGMAAFAVTGLGLGLLGTCAYLAVARIRYQLTFAPTQGVPYPPPKSTYEAHKVQTADGEILCGWFLQPEDGARASSRLVIYFHGNAGNLGDYVGNLDRLAALGFPVLAMDYRGYGESTGKPSESGLLMDAQSILEYAQDGLGYSLSSIILYGFSLGSVPATWLARNCSTLAAVIVQNGFPILWDVAKANHFCPWLMELVSWQSTLLTPKMYLTETMCPITIVHSESDSLAPFRFGKELLDSIPHSNKVFFPLTGTHSEFEFSTDFVTYLQSLSLPPSGGLT